LDLKIKLEDCNMKYFGLAAAALVMSISAFAGTEIITCTSNAVGDGTNSFGVGNVPGMSPATSTCGNFSALPGGESFVGISIVLQADYTGGGGTTTNTTQTTFTGSLADVIQATSAGGATGDGPAFAYTDEASCGSGTPTCSPNAPTFGTNFFSTPDAAANAGNYTTLNVTETFTTAVTGGSVQGVSEQAFLVLTYSSSAPEPGSMMLLGSGLLAAGLIGRKKLAGRK
jgi:hypothetical protein